MNTESSSYGSILQSMVDLYKNKQAMPKDFLNAENGPQFMEELQGCLNNRPVVILKNEEGSIVCFKRPGMPRELQATLLKLVGYTFDVPREPKLKKDEWAFSDLSNPALCSKNPEDLELLYKTCEKMGLVKEFLFEVLSHDLDYIHGADTWGTPHNEFSPLNLEECACANSAYDRLLTDRRYDFEQEFLQHIESTLPNKSETVRVLSLGSGELLQDWKMIGLLLKEGYNNIDWVLVDPINSQEKAISRIENLKNFFSQIKDAHVNITPYNAISDMPSDDTAKAHAMLAIDFDEPNWEDFVASAKNLSGTGVLLLGTGQFDFAITQEGVKVLAKDEQCTKMCQDLESTLTKGYQGPVHIASAGVWAQALIAISTLQKLGVSSFKLTVAPDPKTDVSTLREVIKVFYPSANIELEIASKEEVDKRIGENERFDFILSASSDKTKNWSTESLPQTAPHVLNESSTLYEFGEGLEVFRRSK